MNNVLLVICDANVCRSPVAALLGQRLFPTAKVLSAGLLNTTGLPAHPEMVRLMAERGLDLSQHRAQRVHPLLCDRAKLIWVMGRMQQAHMQGRHPAMQDKIVRLGHFEDADIPDPIGHSDTFFAAVVQQIERGLVSWQAHLTPSLIVKPSSP